MIKQHLERAKEKVYMYNQNFNVIKQHLELAKEKVHAMKQSSDAAEQTIKAMEEESTVKDCQFQAMQKTTLQLQHRLKDKEQEIIGLKKCLLFRWKNTSGPNLKRKQMAQNTGEKKSEVEDEEISTVKQKNEELQSQLYLVEEDLRSKEAYWNVELERLGKEKQGLAGANEALIEKNVQLQKQLNLIQSILRNKEPRPVEQERTGNETRQMAGEKEGLTAGQTTQIQKPIDLNRPKELHLYLEQKKWEKERHAAVPPGGEHEPVAHDRTAGQLQNQPDVVQEEPRPEELHSNLDEQSGKKRQGPAANSEALAEQNGELQNQVDFVQEDLAPKELHPSLDDEKQQGLSGDNETLPDQSGQLQNEPDLVEVEMEELIPEELHSYQDKLGRKRPVLADENKDLAEQNRQTLDEPLG